MAYKPIGYPSVSPYLLVRSAERTLAFLEQVLGAERLRVIRHEGGGGIMHAEARVDDSVIMIGETPEGPEAHVHVYVEDVEQAFDRAKNAGGSVVQALERKGGGDYRGGINDSNGVIWCLSQQDEVKRAGT